MKLNTNNLKLAALLAAALCTPSPLALAADAGAMPGMPGMSQAPAQNAETGHAVGVVTAINAIAKTATIVTEAIPERNWPADMSMDYKVEGDAAMNISVGQKVNFEFVGPGMDVTITKIEKAE